MSIREDARNEATVRNILGFDPHRLQEENLKLRKENEDLKRRLEKVERAYVEINGYD